MNRQEWIQSKATLTIDCLPKRSRAAIRKFDIASPITDLSPAVLMTFICSRYMHLESIDEITARLSSSHFLGAMAQDAILENVVIPACSVFRERRLPFRQWWDAELIHDLFESFYLQRRIQDIGIEAVKKECHTLWGMNDKTLISRICDLANRAAPSAPWEFLRTYDKSQMSDLIARFIEAPETQDVINEDLGRRPPVLYERDDLLDVAIFLITTDVIRIQADETINDRKVANSIIEHIDKAKKHCVDSVEGLSNMEICMLLPLPSEEALLGRVLDSRRNKFELDAMGVNAVPEIINGERHIPMWLHDYVFGRGGRNYHWSAGPIPHFSVVFEASDELPSAKVGLIPVKRSGSRLEVRLIAFDSIHGDLCIPFSFDLKSATNLYDLALMCMTQTMRLDYLRINEMGALEFITPSLLHLPDEWIAELKPIFFEVFLEFFANDPDRIETQFVRERTTDDAGVGILMNEKAKAEQILLELDDDLPAAKPYGLFIKKWKDARREFLRIKSLQADELIQGSLLSVERFQNSAIIARNKVTRTLEELRSIGDTRHCRTPKEISPELKRLAVALDSDSRCLVHLAFRDGYFDVLWLKKADGKIDTGLIDISNVDPSLVVSLVQRWLGARTYFERRGALIEVLKVLGDACSYPIARSLKALGAKQIVICPVGFLDTLPLHLLPIDSGYLLDEFESITYAPSGRVLARLSSRPKLKQNSLLVVGYSGADSKIPEAEREALWISSMREKSTLLIGANATPGNTLEACHRSDIVHIASHGVWYSDWYCSGLRLHPTKGSTGYLSVAKILSHEDSFDSSLVTLSACESGRTLAPINRLQNYAAIDGAFLAKGVKSTVAALWEVEDTASFLFMKAFYLSLREGNTVERALCRAYRFLRNSEYNAEKLPVGWEAFFDMHDSDWRTRIRRSGNDYSDPFFWGAFRSSGLAWITPWATFD